LIKNETPVIQEFFSFNAIRLFPPTNAIAFLPNKTVYSIFVDCNNSAEKRLIVKQK
jgi:hypothetical protein